MWSGVQSWRVQTQAWEETLMNDIVTDDMDKTVNSFVRLAGKAKMKLQSCPATIKLQRKKKKKNIKIYIENKKKKTS